MSEKIESQGSLGVRMMPEHRIHAELVHSTEKAHNAALDDEKYDVCYRGRGCPIGKNMHDST